MISNFDPNDMRSPSIHDVNINDNFVKHILHPEGKSNFTTVSHFSKPYSVMSTTPPRPPFIRNERPKTPTPMESRNEKLFER